MANVKQEAEQDVLSRLNDAIKRAEKAEAACAEMRHVIDAITSDPHNWSMRPCVTCRRASEVMGHLVGCYEFHAQHGKTLEEVKFKPQVGKGWLSPERKNHIVSELRWIANAYNDNLSSIENSGRMYDASCVAKTLLAALEETNE